MHIYSSLPLYLLCLIFSASPSSANLFPRAIQKVHRNAVRHTHNLARDLRVAFGGILVPRVDSSLSSSPVVYCKPGRQSVLGSPGGGGGGGGGMGTNGGDGGTTGNNTSTASTGSGTSRGATASSTGVVGAKPTGSSSPSSPWKLQQAYEGNSFFDGWDFFTGADPTNGIVEYIDQNTAKSNGLLEVNSQGNAVMRVETTPSVAATRKSVRITTQMQFNGGLVIMDSVHMPTGCGTWPAFWTNGPNWPAGGEIDIVEGVHDYTNNQATIHTNVGCTIASTNKDTLAISGSVIGGTDCAALTTGNQGCGIRASTSNSFGAGFNSNGGGVYAMKWDSSGIAVYFFPRGSVPADITNQVPQPDTWGAAQARWPAASCDPFKFFNSHHAIFDTTLCGDWAGGVWTSSGIPGQDQSCAQRTGFSTCEAFVRASGSSFNEAYWEVKSVEIYQLQN
ncbi:endo-1,3(4)-beta-glucanase [Crucibulum laeve]|uniref:Endo-1,3(4)-beta-glucanase n=1 Tax=Crucibulum laeve TaxID=68775 RepID=A0A5C3LY07_9AGAR|nr:endo-1,3(4)-beta-glucanase [Crucibulum laeve]